MPITKGYLASTAQTAIIARLLDDATLIALLGGSRIYDAVPESTVVPYVVVASVTEDTDDTMEDGDAGVGSACDVYLDIMTDDAGAGAGFKQVQLIADRIKVLFHRQPLTLSGWTFVDCVVGSLSCDRDESQAGRLRRRGSVPITVTAEAA